MGDVLRVMIPLLFAAVCGVVSAARGGIPTLTQNAESLIAIALASVLLGFVLRGGWRVTLACVWLTIAEGWVLSALWESGARYALDGHILMTLCAGVLLAASLLLAKPCHEFGARLRNLVEAERQLREMAGQSALQR